MLGLLVFFVVNQLTCNRSKPTVCWGKRFVAQGERHEDRFSDSPCAFPDYIIKAGSASKNMFKKTCTYIID